MAFLDGCPPERLCQPIVDYITGEGPQRRAGDVGLWAGSDGTICESGMARFALLQPALPPTRRPPLPCPSCAARGGEVRMKSGIKDIELNEDGTVK